MIITDQQKQTYLTGGGCRCPFCGSSDIAGGLVEIDQGSAHQDVTCRGCGLAWRDRYQLVDIVRDDADQDPASLSSHTPADPPG